MTLRALFVPSMLLYHRFMAGLYRVPKQTRFDVCVHALYDALQVFEALKDRFGYIEKC